MMVYIYVKKQGVHSIFNIIQVEARIRLVAKVSVQKRNATGGFELKPDPQTSSKF
jgi:hypothetical protein